MKKNILISILLLQVLAVTSQQWIPDPNKKYALWMGGWEYGSCLLTVNDTLYLSGRFLKIGSTNALRIARYYNGNWYPLKGGVDGDANSFLFNNGNLYVSGSFGWADNKPGTMGIARWDGNNWWPVGTNSDCGSCYGTIEYYDNKIFFSGSNMLGLAWGVIAWDGTNWVNRCNLAPVDLLKKYSADLLAGSGFYGLFLKYLGDTSWSSQPYGGIYGGMYKAEIDTVNNLLYVSSDFDWVNINNPIQSHYIAMYDGFGWHSMGTTSGFIYCMKMYNGYLYAGTDSLLNNGSVINYIGRWDGNQWNPLGSGVNNGVNAMEEFHDTLFVTGGFNTAGGDSAYGLARWYMPDTNCSFLKPTIHTLALQDTFYLGTGSINVQFFNNNAYSQTWQWNFGDSGTDSIQNPTHTYTNDSTYIITVTVTEDGCTKTDTATIWVLNGNNTEEYTKENLNFKVYPNPTGGDFTIECTLPQNKTGKVIAYRTTGSQLGEHPLESGFNKFIMPAGNWKDSVILVGVYIESRQVMVEKVVKK